MSNLREASGKFLRTAHLEENKDGDLVLTFTEQELKILGVRPGDLLNFKVIDGKILIKKKKAIKKKKN